MPLSSWQPFPSTSAPKRKPTEPPEDTPVDVESLDTPAPSTSRVQGAIENHIAVKWHIIALQEAMVVPSSRLLDESFSRDPLRRMRYSFSTRDNLPILTLRSAPFTSTIPGVGNIRLSTKDILDCFCRPSSPRASFRRLPPNGKSFSTMMSLHTNHFAKKRGMGKKLLLTVRAVMLQEHVDMVCRRLRRRCMTPPIWQ